MYECSLHALLADKSIGPVSSAIWHPGGAVLATCSGTRSQALGNGTYSGSSDESDGDDVTHISIHSDDSDEDDDDNQRSTSLSETRTGGNEATMRQDNRLAIWSVS
jgi:hypothetical protein